MNFKFSTRVRMVLALVLVAAFVATTLSLSSGNASASSPRSGELHLSKDCSTEPYAGAAGDFCTITVSSLAAITVPAKVVYTSAFGAVTPTALDSDIVLVVGPGNTAFGHVHFDGVTHTGDGAFAGGTGKFTHFHAQFHITVDAAGLFHFDGTYSFSPPN